MGEWAPKRISRKIITNGPVEDVTSIDLQCGGSTIEGQIGSEPAPLHAKAVAGSEVSLRWTHWPDSHMGPVLTYSRSTNTQSGHETLEFDLANLVDSGPMPGFGM